MIDAEQEPVRRRACSSRSTAAAAESLKLARVLEVLVAHEEDPMRQVEFLHQIAELHDVHLDQPREAFGAYARALPPDNSNDRTLAALERLAERLSAWSELVALYDAEIARLREDSPERAIEIALRLAKLCEVQTGSVDDAIARYRIVYEIDPTHPEALEALDRLYESTERWRGIGRGRIARSRGRRQPRRRARTCSIAWVSCSRPGSATSPGDRAVPRDPGGGARVRRRRCAALEGLFAQGIEPAAIGEILEPLYRMQDAWDKLIGVQESVLRSQSGDERPHRHDAPHRRRSPSSA